MPPVETEAESLAKLQAELDQSRLPKNSGLRFAFNDDRNAADSDQSLSDLKAPGAVSNIFGLSDFRKSHLRSQMYVVKRAA